MEEVNMQLLKRESPQMIQCNETSINASHKISNDNPTSDLYSFEDITKTEIFMEKEDDIELIEVEPLAIQPVNINNPSQLDDSFSSGMNEAQNTLLVNSNPSKRKSSAAKNEEPIIKKIAIPKKIKKFSCSINECGYKCSQKSHMLQHENAVHKGIKPYKCSYCDRKCSQKSHLTKHVNTIHKGIKPYNCNQCDHRFSQKSRLTNHVNAVHQGVKEQLQETIAQSQNQKTTKRPPRMTEIQPISRATQTPEYTILPCKPETILIEQMTQTETSGATLHDKTIIPQMNMLKIALFGDSRAAAISRSLMLNEFQLNARLVHCKIINGLTHGKFQAEVLSYLDAKKRGEVTDIWISLFIGDFVKKCSSLKSNIMMLKYKEEGPTVENLCNAMKSLTHHAWITKQVRVIFILPSHVNCLDYLRIQLEKSEVPLHPMALSVWMEAHQSTLVPENDKIKEKCEKLFTTAVKYHLNLDPVTRIELVSTERFMANDQLFWEEEMKSLRGERVGERKYLTDGVCYSDVMVEKIMRQLAIKYVKNFVDKRYLATEEVMLPAFENLKKTEVQEKKRERRRNSC